MKYLLIAIYSTTIITAEPQTSHRKCLLAAKEKIGLEWKTLTNTNPEPSDDNVLINIPPKVVMAFCVKGSAAE